MDSVQKGNSRRWNNALVITEIVPFSYDTYSLKKLDGTTVQKPPENYIHVIPPDHVQKMLPPSNVPENRTVLSRILLAERNLEDFIVQQLEAIEPGLRLVNRQLSTPAGRLDLLCKDINGNHVVIEL